MLWEGTYPPYLQIRLFIFSNFHFPFFYDFLLFSFTWDPIGAKISKRYFSHSVSLISTKLYDKNVSHDPWQIAKIVIPYIPPYVMGEYTHVGYYVLAICPPKYGLLKFFVNIEPYGLENSKRYSS